MICPTLYVKEVPVTNQNGVSLGDSDDRHQDDDEIEEKRTKTSEEGREQGAPETPPICWCPARLREDLREGYNVELVLED